MQKFQLSTPITAERISQLGTSDDISKCCWHVPAGVRRAVLVFEMSHSAGSVIALREAAVFDGRARADHFSGDVAPVGQDASRDEASIPIDVENIASQRVAVDQATPRGGCLLSAAMVPFWRIEPPDPDPARLPTQSEGIAIENLANPGFDLAGLLCEHSLRGAQDRHRGNDRQQCCSTAKPAANALTDILFCHAGR